MLGFFGLDWMVVICGWEEWLHSVGGRWDRRGLVLRDWLAGSVVWIGTVFHGMAGTLIINRNR